MSDPQEINEPAASTSESAPARVSPHRKSKAPLDPARVAACSTHLKERFPAVFAVRTMPLKKGIRQDVESLVVPTFTKRIIAAVIAKHVRSQEYLEAVQSGGPRYNLDGLADGEVTQAEKDHATAKLAVAASRKMERALSRQRKERSDLLKAFEASGQAISTYAVEVGLEVVELEGRLGMARAERAERKARSIQLVQRFNESGLTKEGFCASIAIKPHALDTALRRASTT